MITYIIVGHKYTYEWEHAILSMLLQTDNRWKAIIIHDGPGDHAWAVTRPYVEASGGQIMYMESPQWEGNWGHHCRAQALAIVDTPWVNITNADNYIVPRANAILIEAIEKHSPDVIMSNIIHNHFGYRMLETQFALNATDMANFIVRTEIAQKVGFNHRSLAADGLFVEEIKSAYPDLKLFKSSACLWVHN